MDNYETPLLSALAALVTLVTSYYTKMKKYFVKTIKMYLYIYGDEEKKGAVRRLREAEAAILSLQAHDRQELDINEIILEQQKLIKEALKPIYIQLEKKADKELFEVQLAHILEAIERIGRGQ